MNRKYTKLIFKDVLKLVTLLLGIQNFCIFNTSAECVPGEDPCAPKKVVGAWDTSFNFGYNTTRGNTQTSLLSLAGNAYKEKENNIYELNGMYNFGTDKNAQNAEGDDTTRNDIIARAKYSRLFDERFYGAFGSSYFYDEIADIDHRVTVDPALGYFLLKDNTFKLSLEAGPSYVFEKVAGISNDYLAPAIGDKFEWAITCTSKIFQSANVLFDAEDSNNTLVIAQAGVESALSTNLALVLTLRDIFDNVPAPGNKRNDLAFITALKVKI
jgi:putative salt-induced outer membrane protein YdiY